jgi:hypothetical protein
MYTTRDLLKIISQINTKILINVIDCLINFFWIFLTCESHFSLVSICSSRTQMFVFNLMMLLIMLRITIMLNFFEFLMKWINSYLIDANINSCWAAHFSQRRCTLFSVLQFFFVLLSYVSMLTLSAYLRDFVFVLSLSHIFNRSAL